MPLRHPVATEEPRVVPLGRLVAGHGVRGLARVKPFNPGSPTLRACREAFLTPRGEGKRRLLRVRECRPHRGMFLVAFEGIDSLDALQPWIGSLVEVDAELLPEPAADELYHHEAIGLEVRLRDGSRLGRVVEVMALPANDLWVVHDVDDGADARRPTGPGEKRKPREWLIPVVAPIVAEIDLRAGVAVIDAIPGLLDDP